MSLSTHGTSLPLSDQLSPNCPVRSWSLFSTLSHALIGTALYPATTLSPPTHMGFAENQLSLSLISLSPLTTGRRRALPRPPVRASTHSYVRFTLPLVSSLRFGSPQQDTHSCGHSSSSRRHCGLPDYALLETLAGPLYQKYTVRCPLTSPPVVCSQYCFSPFPHGTLLYRSRVSLPFGRWYCPLPVCHTRTLTGIPAHVARHYSSHHFCLAVLRY